MIRFIASLPPIQSAVTVSGNGDGARIRLEVPETELAEALRILLLRGQVFTVTIAPMGGEDDGTD